MDSETFRLPAGFRVELSGISGVVDIQSHDGDEAEVHIVHGPKVEIEQSSTALVIRGRREANEVRLKLPRQITLVVETIHGPLEIGDVDGLVSVNSVSGNVVVGKINGSLNVHSVSGSVSARIAALDENGVHVNSISGPVELIVENKLDADIKVEHVSGKIVVELDGAATHKHEISTAHVVVGEGTAPILISNISGPVRIAQK